MTARLADPVGPTHTAPITTTDDLVRDWSREV